MTDVPRETQHGWKRAGKYFSTRGEYTVSGNRVRDQWRYLTWCYRELLGAADSFGEAVALADTDEKKRGLDAHTAGQT